MALSQVYALKLVTFFFYSAVMRKGGRETDWGKFRSVRGGGGGGESVG